MFQFSTSWIAETDVDYDGHSRYFELNLQPSYGDLISLHSLLSDTRACPFASKLLVVFQEEEEDEEEEPQTMADFLFNLTTW